MGERVGGQGPVFGEENQSSESGTAVEERFLAVIDTSAGANVPEEMSEPDADESGIPVIHHDDWIGDESSGHPENEVFVGLSHTISPPDRLRDVLQEAAIREV